MRSRRSTSNSTPTRSHTWKSPTSRTPSLASSKGIAARDPRCGPRLARPSRTASLTSDQFRPLLVSVEDGGNDGDGGRRMSTELLARARAGDRDAFAALVEPHRGELQGHCYRMLGSLQDAEDALQETLLSAWLGLDGFEGRSSVRTWLYRIATNRCLNVLRSSGRRPVTAAPLPIAAPEPTRLGEVLWLQPYPDVLLDDQVDVLSDQAPGPEARYESREAISLAFITAVQLLPPSQRAVLLLRDVLGYRAKETAQLLGVTKDSVTSALKRARVTMDTARPPGPPPPPPGSAQERVLVDRFVAAFTDLDVDALVALMTDDIWVRMPPLP